MCKPKVIVICGPTASGKTALSIKLAKEIDGEIISSDSMQIYKDMDIGTAKPTKEEMQGVAHYMLDCVLPNERYSVTQYQKEARDNIKKILKKGKSPIVVGGTGLYIDSIIYETIYPEITWSPEYRNELEKEAEEKGLENLYKMALEIDPKAMAKISKNDRKRILRVLEIYHETGHTKTEWEQKSKKEDKDYNYFVFAIDFPREILYERINKRVDMMINQGLIDEVKKVQEKYKEFPTAMQGLGYKEVVEYLKGYITKEEMIEKVKRETRRYAKRQLTWFRRNKEIIWLDGMDKMQNNVNVILEVVNGKT